MSYWIYIFAALFFVMECPRLIASESLIEIRAMMGVYADSSINRSAEGAAIKNIKEIKAIETGFGFSQNYPPEEISPVTGRHGFTELPCVKMYSLFTGKMRTEADEDPYGTILFNTCDSSTYNFGGNTSRFSQVIRDYLRNWRDRDSMLALLHFYLNTLMIEDDYYILSKPSDFATTTRYYNAREGEWDSIYYSPEQFRNDSTLIEQTIHPLLFNTDNCQSEMIFFTWEHEYGKLEFWRFAITREFIQIVERRKIISNIGPHNLMR